MTIDERNDCYKARRIIRADPNGRTFKTLSKQASSRVKRLVEILPPLYAVHCVAQAEALAVEQYNEER